MLDTYARKKINFIFEKTAKILIKCGITPNFITSIALIVGLISGILLYFEYRLLSVVFLWTSGFLDAVDGSMARISKTSSLKGALFDIVSDRIVELSIFWALALRNPESLLAMLGLVSAVLLSMTIFLTTGMLADKKGEKSFYYQAGLMERTEGFIASTAMIFLKNNLVMLTWLYAFLIIITIFQRLKEASKIL